jgi:hypothetical protein
MNPAPVPDAQERARLNAALQSSGVESGFWDEHGNPAPWPDDIDDWAPATRPSQTQGPRDF